ncbi:trypsin-like serine peptidase [Sinimarinibacterium flocculans]|uniref:Trypsin n=1 Tax=Sinimarinibacterium flocculans TaxID=985250 RepID=A0A318EJI1_9GAMM|nr:trypsin-like serine protease [Sinimarinibacterium flocculans]PXV71042.1 trypsin [Sinimarinibacterium flocculans]
MRLFLTLAVTLWLPAVLAAPQPDLGDLDLLPLHATSPVAVAKAVEAAQRSKTPGPALFAVSVELPLGLDDGIWDAPEPGVARWRTRVYSAEAQALIMSFGRFDLPAGAALWVYDAQGRTLQGPYTGARGDEALWTAMVPGDTAVIELRVPGAQRLNTSLALSRVGHAFKNAAQLGDSGACNIDTACALGSGWRDESRAVVKLQIPAGLFVGLCTGTLVNNTAEDGTPYVLTADHCGIGTLGSPASGVVVYWNFQNSSCGGAPDAISNQTQSGARLRADDRETDLTLIELDERPSAAFNAYYAGWDASGRGGNQGVGIHHPSGDAKKISEFTVPLQAANVQIEVAGPSIPAWRVDRWQQGTTEQGSSGSGLWNESRHIVGILSGGSAACNGNVDNDQPDFYARLDRQWEAGTAASGQLKAWLDPIDSGALQISGRNAGGGGGSTAGGGTGGGGGGGGAFGWGSLLFGGLLLMARRRR